MPVQKSLDLLDPSIQEAARKAIAAMNADPIIKAAGYTVQVSETLRDMDVQMAYVSRLLASYVEEKYKAVAVEFVQNMYRAAGLYEIDAVSALKPVSWTLKSPHFSRLAFDVMLVKNGKADWNAPLMVWKLVGAIGKSYGFEWGGDWPERQADSPHFQRKQENPA